MWARFVSFRTKSRDGFFLTPHCNFRFRKDGKLLDYLSKLLRSYELGSWYHKMTF